MSYVGLIEVSDYMGFSSEKTADEPRHRHQLPESPRLARDLHKINAQVAPRSFDIRIHLTASDRETAPSPSRWLADATRQTSQSKEVDKEIDFLTLPGLHATQLTEPDEKGKGAAVTFRFDDWSEYGTQTALEELMKKSYIRNRAARGHRIAEQQHDMMDDSFCESVREAYLDLIVGRLLNAGMIQWDAAKLSLMEAYDLDPKEAVEYARDCMVAARDIAWTISSDSVSNAPRR